MLKLLGRGPFISHPLTCDLERKNVPTYNKLVELVPVRSKTKAHL